MEMGFLTPSCTEEGSSGGLPCPGTMHMCVCCVFVVFVVFVVFTLHLA